MKVWVLSCSLKTILLKIHQDKADKDSQTPDKAIVSSARFYCFSTAVGLRHVLPLPEALPPAQQPLIH